MLPVKMHQTLPLLAFIVLAVFIPSNAENKLANELINNVVNRMTKVEWTFNFWKKDGKEAKIMRGTSISCYQCDSRFDPDCKEKFDHAHVDQMIIRPTECTVDAAQYCIKTIGVWGGIVGTTRFCSSRDMFNSCQYVTYPNHNRIYRACIFTCNTDNCNSASVSAASVIALIVSLLVAVLTVRLC